MGITTYAGDTLDTEVERFNGKSGLFEERHNEASKAAIHVQTNAMLFRESSEGYDVVHASIWEVYGRPYYLW